MWSVLSEILFIERGRISVVTNNFFFSFYDLTFSSIYLCKIHHNTQPTERTTHSSVHTKHSFWHLCVWFLMLFEFFLVSCFFLSICFFSFSCFFFSFFPLCYFFSLILTQQETVRFVPFCVCLLLCVGQSRNVIVGGVHTISIIFIRVYDVRCYVHVVCWW